MVKLMRKLSAEDLAKTSMKSGRPKDWYLPQYKSFFDGIEVHEGGEISLDDGEKKQTVKNRLTRAAQELGKTIEFRRSGDQTLRFRVINPEEKKSRPSRRPSAAAPAESGKRGRKKSS